jgi:intracellular multiplication protein IcmP
MAQQQQQENNDILYVIGALFIVVLVAKYFFGEAVLHAHLWLRQMWVNLAMLVWDTPRLEAVHTTFSAYAPSEWDSARVSALSRLVSWWAFPILGGVLAFYGWRVIQNNPAGKYKRVYTTDSLARSQTSLWPWMLPALDKDAIHSPINEGPYAMGMTEMEFCRHYRLLESTERLTLNDMKTEKLFASQLGRLWEGHGQLRRHERALYACFIAQLCGNREACLDGLRDLTFSMSQGKLDTTKTDALLQKYRHDKRVRQVTSKHAYVSTVMSAVLERARLMGKIPPVFFLWLRAYDRALWYTLQSAGRNTPFTEAGGVYSHYMAEIIARHPIEYPFVKPAVDGLKEELKKIKITQEYGDHGAIG